MPIKKVFVKEIVNVVPAGDDFDIGILFFIAAPDGNGSDSYTIHFIAPWGSDWRLQCRNAIVEYVAIVRQEQVDGVVFPDLSTI